MAKRKTSGGGKVVSTELQVDDYRHKGAKRKNNPPAKIAAEGTVPAIPKARYYYNPHLSPTLRFDSTGRADQLAELVAKATHETLTPDEAKMLNDALRAHQPWLEWSEKREQHERGYFDVDPVALHIHERVSTQAILKVAARQDVQRSLFADPEQQYHEAVQFYRHDIDWTNRLILGDSLQVMSSLARRENLAGKVQMIYMDPPYGVKFKSNFQPEVSRSDIKDRDKDLTREVETVKAYRDTWHLGLHSYLTYMRDRLTVARELLNDSGSIFVQISDENLHTVRQVMDEVYGKTNFLAIIWFAKTTGQASRLLPSSGDYLLWYASDRKKVKYRQLFWQKKTDELASYSLIESPLGEWRRMSNDEVQNNELIPSGWRIFSAQNFRSQGATESDHGRLQFQGREFRCGSSNHWKTTPEGRQRLIRADRLLLLGETANYKRFMEDFPIYPITDRWDDTAIAGFSGEEKVYAVQTAEKVVERCLLMATDPGDLIIDPTCGGGTTAVVAEKRGRRWITVDTSRVAMAIARQRILTSKFDFYELHDAASGVAQGFKCKTAFHIKLERIAQDTNLDPIFEKHEPILDGILEAANRALAKVDDAARRTLATKLAEKCAADKMSSVTDADQRRWLLPKTKSGVVSEAITRAFQSARKKLPTAKQVVEITKAIPPESSWRHWEVPFDIDSDWPKELQDAVTAYRTAWRAKMDEVNACIAANAEHEELVDQPKVVKGVVRVSGPFTVEAVQPPELTLGENIEPQTGADEGLFLGAPDELAEGFEPRELRVVDPRPEMDVTNVAAYLDQMQRYLRMDGVGFPNNKRMKFTRLEPKHSSEPGIHAEGRWTTDCETDTDPEGRATVGVAFGPQYGPVTAMMVEGAIRSANRMGYDALVVAGFSFDGNAHAIFDEPTHTKLQLHLAHIRPDVNPGMNGLLKEQPRSQLFSVFGQPRTRVERENGGKEYVATMEGVDIYNPVENSIVSTGAEKVAAWFVDGDYNGQTFCITQAFFPDKSAWDKLAKALRGVVEPEVFAAYGGTTSLSFPIGKHKCAAVKVIDPRGNEAMRVHRLV